MRLFPKHSGLKVLVLIGYIVGAIIALPFAGGFAILIIQLITGDIKHVKIILPFFFFFQKRASMFYFNIL